MSYNKFKNKKTEIDGIKFDSEMESHYYLYLIHLKEIGEVVDFELQPTYILQEGFTKDGKKIRPITYRADFRVIYVDGHEEVIDVKGRVTAEFSLKRKMLLYKYRDINFKCVQERGRKPNKYWVEI
jgi:hypothetical protein